MKEKVVVGMKSDEEGEEKAGSVEDWASKESAPGLRFQERERVEELVMGGRGLRVGGGRRTVREADWEVEPRALESLEKKMVAGWRPGSVEGALMVAVTVTFEPGGREPLEVEKARQGARVETDQARVAEPELVRV